MKIEKAKKIQSIMIRVETNSKLLIDYQVKARASILDAITAGEEKQVDLGGTFWALVTCGSELSLAVEELQEVIEPFLD
jgi:hypothetical protein